MGAKGSRQGVERRQRGREEAKGQGGGKGAGRKRERKEKRVRERKGVVELGREGIEGPGGKKLGIGTGWKCDRNCLKLSVTY